MRRLVKICEKEIRIEGRLLRTGMLEGDGYQFLDDPEPLLERLRKREATVDLFTFMQRLPETARKYS